MKMRRLKNSKAQSEVITTVLLILIGITAVILVSGFVINLVRNNLKGTDCFQTTGQLSINTDGGYSYFNSNGNLSVSIERGSKAFNLTGINIIYGTGSSTKKVYVRNGAGSSEEVYYILPNGTIVHNATELPDSSETKTYIIDTTSSGMSSVNTVLIEVVIDKDVSCGKTDEASIATRN